ncbi:MunI family type II restriction endonuclease [Neisseria bacilliformis]|uniref:MunI family type II restriction endonuclease n=1 Tax=Neisseria bacilliformis TaxID=267212 RepID=UPI003C730F6D
MASTQLRQRSNWQTISGNLALQAEEKFRNGLQSALDSVYPGQFYIEAHPSDFKDIYSNHKLPSDTSNKIYNPDIYKNGKLMYHWGIKMDFAIRNLTNNKVLFGEIKRQDGWVENTSPAAGRGNAHERSCKYFTPGLLNILRIKSGISNEILPFWLVLVGDITRDPKRNREIAYWYQGYEKNYFMWRNTNDLGELLDFFENNLLPYLL